MNKVSFSDRLRYRFDNTLSKGPIALIGWLGLATAILVILATVIDLAVGGRSDQLGPFQVFWDILSQALTPNPVDPGNPWQFLVVMLVVTLGSLFMVSILIGVLTAAIENQVQALRRGRSKVIEDGHTILLGWSEQVFSIVSELVIANQNQPRSCIVIMGDRDKVEMEDEIREKVGATGRTRVVCRNGNPIDLTDLEIVSLNTSKSIVVLAPESADPDSNVIKTILAITNNPKRRAAPYHIVAEVSDAKNMEVARLVGKDEAELVLSGDLIARIIAQTCRQSGLSVVYTELLDFGGDEIYFKEEPGLVGKTFGESLLMYEASAVIALMPKGGAPKLNPPMDTVIQPGDQIVAVSEDDDTVVLSGLTELNINHGAIHLKDAEPPTPERTLVLGWNERAPSIINELDNYVAHGSAVTVVADFPGADDKIAWCCPDLINQTVQFQVGDTTDRRTLDKLKIETYRHVIVLSYSDTLDAQEADARTLVTLLHLRDIAERAGHPFSIVSEMLDVRNRALAEVAQVDDFIVSDKLISLMLSQISENKKLNAVFADIFDPEGSEIYLKLAANYVALDQPINFYTVVEAARQRGEIALGYRLRAHANDPEKAYGVVVNPDKSKPITFSQWDRIVVVAEN